MGSPDYYPGDEHCREITPPSPTNLPMHGHINDSDSDDNGIDNTNEDINDPHAGYQLLSQAQDGPHQSMEIENFAQFSDQDDDDDENNPSDNNQESVISVEYPNLPKIDPVDGELMRNVWNAPRPAELDIDIDHKRSEEVMVIILCI